MIHIITLTYKKPLNIVDQHLDNHRDFLKKGYNKSLFIASGPQTPRTGGIIIARGDLKDLKKFMTKDPFLLNDVASYHYASFTAALYDDLFKTYL